MLYLQWWIYEYNYRTAKHSLNASYGNHWIIYKKICNGNNLYLKSKIELFNPENERVLRETQMTACWRQIYSSKKRMIRYLVHFVHFCLTSRTISIISNLFVRVCLRSPCFSYNVPKSYCDRGDKDNIYNSHLALIWKGYTLL